MRRVFVSNWQSSMAILWRSLLLLFLAVLPVQALAQGARLTVVELNVENLFDTHHDSLKRDEDFLPEGRYRWTPLATGGSSTASGRRSSLVEPTRPVGNFPTS